MRCEILSIMRFLIRYRLRQSRYRIVYEGRDTEVVVIVIRTGHRRHAYRVR